MVHWIRILTAVFAVLCAAFTSGLLAFLVLTKIFMGGWKTLVAELLGWEFIALVYAYLGVPCAALGLLLHYVDRNRSAILNRVLLWSIGLLVVPVLMFVVGQLLVAVLTSRPPANF